MNMLRLFESTVGKTWKKPSFRRNSGSFLSLSIYRTVPPGKSDINLGKKVFIQKFFIFSFLMTLFSNCVPTPPLVSPGGLVLLRDLTSTHSTLVPAGQSVQTPEVQSSEQVTEVPEQSYVMFARSEFQFYVGEEIEIAPTETKNIKSGRVIGFLPEGLEFEESTLTLKGRIDSPMPRTKVGLQFITYKKNRLNYNFFLAVNEEAEEEITPLTPEKEKPGLGRDRD